MINLHVSLRIYRCTYDQREQEYKDYDFRFMPKALTSNTSSSNPLSDPEAPARINGPPEGDWLNGCCWMP